MKTFSIILMVVGLVLAFCKLDSSNNNMVLVCAIFGSTLFGSGVIALAITQAFGKKS